MTYEDILYDARDGVAWITINRPEVRNAFRAKTVDELIAAFRAAWGDPDVGVVVLTGAGDKAFSAGGDQRERSAGGYGSGAGLGMDVHGLHGVIRAILLNHTYHHRGQLSTYLRQLGVALPSIYGPSADENPFM